MRALLEWWKGWKFKRRKKALWQAIPAGLWWSVWRMRNNIIFNNKGASWEELFELIKLRVIFWVKAKYGLNGYSVNQLAIQMRGVVDIS